MLSKAEIEVYTGASGNVRNAIDDYKAGRLTKVESANLESKFGEKEGKKAMSMPQGNPNNPSSCRGGMGKAVGRPMGGRTGKQFGRGPGGYCVSLLVEQGYLISEECRAPQLSVPSVGQAW